MVLNNTCIVDEGKDIHKMKLNSNIFYCMYIVQSDVNIKKSQQKAHKLETAQRAMSISGITDLVIISYSEHNSVHQVQLLTSVNINIIITI